MPSEELQSDTTVQRRVDAAAKLERGDLTFYRLSDGRRVLRVWEGDGRTIEEGADARFYEIVPPKFGPTTR